MFKTVFSAQFKNGATVLIESGEDEETYLTVIGGKTFQHYRDIIQSVTVGNKAMYIVIRPGYSLTMGGMTNFIDWREVNV